MHRIIRIIRINNVIKLPKKKIVGKPTLTLDELRGYSLEMPSVVERLWPKYGRMLFSTNGGYGKTTLATLLACQLASDKAYSWLGYNVPETSYSVTYLATESYPISVSKLMTFADILELSDEEFKRIKVTGDTNKAYCDESEIVIIDTLLQFLNGNLSNSTIATMFNAMHPQVSYLIVHHLGKKSTVELGGTALDAGIDTSLYGFFAGKDEFDNPDKTSDRLLKQAKNKYYETDGQTYRVTLQDRGIGTLVPSIDEYKQETIDPFQRWKELCLEYLLTHDKISLHAMQTYVLGRKISRVQDKFGKFAKQWIDMENRKVRDNAEFEG